MNTRSFISRITFFFILSQTLPLILYAQVLVDFGSDASQNSTPYSGWSTVIKSDNVHYSAAGPGGTIRSTAVDKYDGYQGITGTSRTFSIGEQIVVTWYNTTGSNRTIEPLVTFDDIDRPVNSTGEPQWHAMSKVTIPAYSSGETTYNIIDGFPLAGVNSAGDHSVVNVCLYSPYYTNELVCDKIEIRSVDGTPPSTPTGVSIDSYSSNSISVSWLPSTDNVAVDKYLVYANSKIVGETIDPQFDIHLLTPDTEYSITVLAMDALRNKSTVSNSVIQSTAALADLDLIHPLNDIIYLGAFKLPDPGDCGTRECSWSYRSGHGLTWSPIGDPDNIDDFPGSLIGFGSTKMAAELSIPVPVNSTNMGDLNRATTLKPFTTTFYENGAYNDEAVAGLTWSPPKGSQMRAKLWYSRGHQHKESTSGYETKPVTHGLAHADLQDPVIPASWFIGAEGDYPNYFSYHAIMFTIPDAWANSHNIAGYTLANSGSRSGAAPNGPGLIAISPWQDQDPWPGLEQQLSFQRLLEYEYDDAKSINGFHIADRYEGGEWIDTPDKSAVLFTSQKAYGEYWYGYPEGPEANTHDVPSYPGSSYKGWYSSRCTSTLIFYNPDELALVIQGTLDTWEPQPYAALDLSDMMVHQDRIMACAFDPYRGYLYVFEQAAENDTRGVIHVFQIDDYTKPAPQYLQCRAWLQGCYDSDTGSHQTGQVFQDALALQLDSPFAQAPHTIHSMPAYVTDWVLLELLDETTQTVVHQQSLLLLENGYLYDPASASTFIDPEVPEGNYFVRIKHRNHLAVQSKLPVTLAEGQLAQIDFATDSGQYHDSATFVELDSGVFGMQAGDITGDRQINVNDYDAWLIQALAAPFGYQQADLNFDGYINTCDYVLYYNNKSTSP